MKWEYLRVTIYANVGSNPSFHIHPLRVDVFGDDGKGFEWKKESGDKSHSAVISRLLAKLGDEGWELAGTVQGGDNWSAVLYFKRPKP